MTLLSAGTAAITQPASSSTITNWASCCGGRWAVRAVSALQRLGCSRQLDRREGTDTAASVGKTNAARVRL